MRRLFLIAGALVCLGPPSWAGREFPARVGEAVIDRQFLVKLKPGVLPSSVLTGQLQGAATRAHRLPDLYIVNTLPGTPSAALTALAGHALVEFVEPDRIRRTSIQSPNDSLLASQWALQTLQAVQAWGVIPNRYLTAALAGSGRITVAILDTGSDCTHPDFKNSGGTSTDSALGGQLQFSSSQALVPTTVTTPACAWQDDYGHGTHVAGIVAAATQNATGVAALGFPLQVITYKVLDNTGSGSDSAVANAIKAAADAGAQIISLSLGAAGYSQTLQSAVNYAWQRNSLVVAAAGNSSSSALFFPAGANYAVGVAATDSSNARAGFSNFGPSVDVAAPGVSILSTLPTYANAFGTLNYGSLSGTSMATPHVSALAGLLSMTTPNASAASIVLRLQQSASSSAVSGAWDQNFGYGIINAYNAVAGNLRPASVGGLVGQITDVNSLPVNAAQISVNGQSMTVDSTGLYRFPALAAGSYPVSITASGYATQNLTATIAPGADTTLPVTMGVSYGRFTGTVTHAGVPVSGAIVQSISSNLIVSSTVTDISGQYSLWTPAGVYDLRVSAVSRSTDTVTAKTVSGGGATTVNLTIANPGIISGVVRDGSLNPVPNAQIIIAGAGITGGTTADSNGNYSSAGLLAGSYTVTSSAAGFPDSVNNNVVVVTDAVTTLNIQMTAAGGPAWYNSAWTNRRKITINHLKVAGGVDLLNFPMLVSVTDVELKTVGNGGKVGRNDGTDILFTAGDGTTKLSHELESYSASAGAAGAWVRIPNTSASVDTVIYVYYGNVGAADQQNRTGVWDSNYVGVWHLENGTTLNAADSTSNNNNGSITGAGATAGRIDGAASLSGSNQYINVGAGASLGMAGDLTIEAWINPANYGNYAGLLGKTTSNLPAPYDYYLIPGTGQPVFFRGDGAVYSSVLGASAPGTGTWSQIAVAASGTSVTHYLNGAANGGGTVTAPAGNGGGNAYIGTRSDLLTMFRGGMDEVRISNITRSAGWIATGYNNQNSPSTFYSLGVSESSGVATVAVSVTTAPSGLALTVDGGGCAAPCAFQWVAGSSHTIASAGTQAGAAGTQYLFANWSDGGALSHVVTTPSSSPTYVASFTTQYALTTAANPSAGGTISPLSNWYNSGAVVAVSAVANNGYQFSGFGGGLAGTATPQNLTMNGPVAVTANFAVSGSGPAWYNSAWTNRRKITINHLKVAGGVDLLNFPMLVSVTDPELKTVGNGGKVGKSDGTDILFTAGDGTTKLSHELESYSPVAGAAGAWVRIPNTSASVDTVIYVYYGNVGAADQQNKTGVWDSTYVGVWHLENGVTLNASDSTSNSNNGSITGAGATAGWIDGAASLSGSNQYINVGAGASLGITGDLTIEAWINPANYSNYAGLLGKTNSNLPAPYDYYLVQGTGQPVFFRGNGAVYSYVLGSNAPSAGAWSQIAVAASGTAVTHYLNGSANGSGTATAPVGNGGGNAYIGTRGDLLTMFRGGMDEVRISNIARSAGWIATGYNNQNSPSTFYSLGVSESSGVATVAVSVTTAPSGLALTVDGGGCTAPCAFQWVVGSTHTIATTATQAGSAGTQYVFASWSDGGALSHSVTGPSSPATYTASFTTQYALTTTANPALEGTISPLSNWYNSGAVVAVSAAANSGYQFTGFSGGLAGTLTPQNVTMNGPVAVTANFAVSGSGPAWYNSAWTNRRKITINHLKVAGGVDLLNFPMLVSVTDVELKTVGNGGKVGNGDGTDILFTAGDGTTKLSHELESYSPVAGAAGAWVRIPNTSASVDTVIYVYYGNVGAADQQNRTGVWDSNYVGVWHLENSTTLNAADSTSNNNNGSITGAGATAGRIDGAASLSGSNQYINVGAGASLGMAGDLTIEAWINPANYSNYAGLLGKTISNLPAPYDYYLVQGTGQPVFFRGNGAVYSSVYGSNAPSTGTWSQIAVAMSGTSVTHYLNGAANGGGTVTAPAGNGGGNAYIGARSDLATMFRGGMDEVRISNITRSAGWIATEYNNQNSPSTFFSLGASESGGAATAQKR